MTRLFPPVQCRVTIKILIDRGTLRDMLRRAKLLDLAEIAAAYRQLAESRDSP